MKKVLVIIFLGIFSISPGFAEGENKGKSGYDKESNFSGPGSTTEQLEEDDQVKAPAFVFESFDKVLAPWFEWKSQLNQNTGLQLGVAYTSLIQSASDAPAGVDDTASSGILRISGRWGLHNSDSGNSGTLVFSADHRYAYDGDVPADLGFAVGYLGIPGTLFNNSKSTLGDFNWQYSFNGGQSGLVAGRYDPNDFIDVLGYANPWTTFQNLSILFNASIALPDFGTGFGLGHWFNEQWYGLASISDANGVVTKTRFFEDFDELYSTAEVGWSPSKADRYFKNVHLTVWDVDERVQDGVPTADGFAVSGNWTWNGKMMIFAKFGDSDGTVQLYSKSLTLGMIFYIEQRTDLFGFAVNRGQPADPSLPEQTSAEMFYRFQLAQNLAITPSIQLIKDPALNPSEDEIIFTGLRARFSF